MSGRVLAAVLVAALACGGCDGRAVEPDDPQPVGDGPEVRFSASVEVGERAVHVRYELTNTSGEPLTVFNRVPSYTPSGGLDTPDPGAVYVVGSTLDGRVQIAKRVFPRPDTDRMTWAMTPRVAATVVAAGVSVGEEFDVPLPLTRRHPYGEDFGDGPIALPDPVRDVVFCLGVARQAEVARYAGPVDGPSPVADEISLPHLSIVTDRQHLSCSAPARL
ncbi:hypothetical protein GCM10023107_72740 [Actinoplanes octamycinicus]|nr:hypothetical protein Aoc01nite_61680 [Actinoplanes octamycinicus]